MEIVFDVPKREEQWLSNLPYGGLFKFPGGEAVYIRVSDFLLSGAEHYGSISLLSGNYYRSKDKRIIELEGTLTVTELMRR